MALTAYLDSLDGIPETIQKEYKQVQEGDKSYFVLDIEGGYLDREDPTVLKRAKDHEKKARQDAETKLKQLQASLETKSTEIEEMRKGNIPKGDVEALERSWKEKHSALETTYKGEIAARDKTLQNLLVDNVANTLANEISVAPRLMLPHVKSRLTTELVDGQYVTRVLDKEGKPSALSIEELRKDLLSDKEFSTILKGSKASGGGASGGNGSTKPAGSGASSFDPTKKFDYNKASPREIAQYQKDKRAWEESQRSTGG